jgi:hypothetical protein
MANIYDMVDEWDDGVTTFTSIKMNVTDTASAAASLLMDLQVGGVSQFSVTKQGRLKVAKVWTLPDEPFAGEYFALGSNDNTSIKGVESSSQLGFSVGTKYYLGNKNSAFEMNTAVALGWSASPGSGHSSATRSGDLYLFRDAANTLAQRNSTNAQTFNLYNTYTDASNYERGFMKWNSNVLEIGTEGAGTGSNFRSLLFKRGATTLLELNSAQVRIGGNLTWTQGSVANIIFPEDSVAPAGIANNAIIFAEDDGAGKTRLMVQFGTGAAQQIAIEP